MRSVVTLVRVASALCCVAYLALVAAILVNGDPALATSVIQNTEEWLRREGAPEWMTWGQRVQMMLNALMFAPVTALAAVALPTHPWGNWVAYAFIASGTAEVFQAFVLEPRAAEYVDVVANTLGGLIGAVAALPVTVAMARSLTRERSV